MNMQIKQQFFGQGAAVATVKLEEINQFLMDNLNLPSRLFVSKEQLTQFIQSYAQQVQQQGALPAPTTTAGRVNYPENRGVTI
jgi:hypothetical protein